MSLIDPWDDFSQKPENKNRNLEGNSYQKWTLKFHGWMKWTQQPNGFPVNDIEYGQ